MNPKKHLTYLTEAIVCVDQLNTLEKEGLVHRFELLLNWCGKH